MQQNIIRYQTDCVNMASFTGHVIIIFDKRSCIKSVSIVLAWRSLQTQEDLLFLALCHAKKYTKPLTWNPYKNAFQNRTRKIQGTRNKNEDGVDSGE